MDISTLISQLKGVGLGNVVIIATIVMSLVQITPIKLDPWTALFRWIGKLINGELMEEVKSIKDEINELKRKTDEAEAQRERDRAEAARKEILIFDDELRRGIDHSEELFNQVLDSINLYKKFCHNHPDYENSKAVNAISHINETYKHIKAENKFI